MPSFKDPLRLIVPFIYGLLFLKSPCHSFHMWTEPWKKDTEVDPMWIQLLCTLCTDIPHNPQWGSPSCASCSISKVKELQIHCLLHPSRPPRPPSWLPLVPQEGHHLVRKAARSGAVAVSKGQLPFPILQGDESSQCSMSHWDKVAALPTESVCHVLLVLSKELSRHESRACVALLRADSIWKPSVCPSTRSTTGAALSFSNWLSQEPARYCNP